MTKRLSAVTGEYQKDGQPKAEWTNIGVMIVGKNGKDYVLLDPTINLAGVLLKQNILAAKKGEMPSDMIMLSVFEENNHQQQNQPPQQNYNQQSSPQQSYNQAPQQNYNKAPAQGYSQR